jgi:predicted GNAT family N-acyltransferase
MKVITVSTKNEALDNVLVRGKVFIVGQNIDWDLEFDGLDNESVLFNAYIDDKVVGAARLYTNKVGRVATLDEFRKQGVATAIMTAIEEYARENNINTLKLNAQLYVADFYEKLGYIRYGSIFQEAEIDHVAMKKKLK